MSSTSLAHPGTVSTTEPLPGYVLRGLGLFELHRQEILESYQGGGRWLVPSGSKAGMVYEVRVGTRPERDRCECVGFSHHHHCSHVEAAHRTARLSAVCDACGTRRWGSELVEVLEEDGLLSWFPGDHICQVCVAAGF